ncbi:MAG: NAD-dependent epimerase/dehydratase family protein [Pseudonocardiaceae bacterium]
MADRVLVTGAAGFIGGRLAVALNEAGWEVTSVDTRRMSAAVRSQSRAITSDYREADLLARVRAGEFRAVVHQGAISNTLEFDWARLKEMNLEGSLALAEACLSGSAVFVYASSFSVYGRIFRTVPVAEDAVDDNNLCSGPLNLYAESKLALDRAMPHFTGCGLRWAGLRYTNVFAEGEEQDRASSVISQMVTKAARRQRIELFADTLQASRDYVPMNFVSSVVRGLLRVDFEPGCYNTGAGQAVSFATLLQWCTEFDDGGPVDVHPIPNPIGSRYQYWTCANVSKLLAALPQLRPVTLSEVYEEARRMFHYIRRGVGTA